MEKQIIWRGLVAGVVGGVLTFAFSKVFLEPVIGRAIDFEDGTATAREAMEVAAGHGHSHGDGGELFSRGVQSTVGLGFGVVLFAVAMGALFAVVFAVAYGRVGNISARATAVLVAGAMFLALWVVPALKYPPNPPATSDDATITQRTLLYLLMVGLSAVSMVAAVYLGRQLTARWGAWNATLVAAASYMIVTSVLMLVLPTVNETPGPMTDEAGALVFPGFPAADLYEFRLYTVMAQLIMWTAIALVFGALAAKVLDEKPQDAMSA